jgi:hypothetical protein
MMVIGSGQLFIRTVLDPTGWKITNLVADSGAITRFIQIGVEINMSR